MTSIRKLVAALGAVALASCAGDKGVAPAITPAESTLGTVAVSPPNAVMAIGQTLQLNVSGRTLTGEAITAFDSVKYLFNNRNDTLRVRVSATGEVTALTATANNTPAVVTVLPFKNGAAKSDDIIIQVTATALTGVSLSIQPPAGDSAKLAQNITKIIVPRLTNASAQSVPNAVMRLSVRPADATRVQGYQPLCVAFAGLDRGTTCQRNVNANVQTNRIFAVAMSGTGWIYARANVYGTDLVDSVQYTFSPGYALSYSTSSIGLRLNMPDNVTAYLSPTGTWTMQSFFGVAVPVSVVFDDPAAAGPAATPSVNGGSSGNVVNLMPQQNTARRFNTPGTYRWTLTVGGNVAPFSGQTAKGTIIVQP